jgi:hypothetical protein
MDEILRFLLYHGSFLYNDLGLRFVDSRVSKSFGGDSWLILANDRVRFRMVRDRAQLFADFQMATSAARDEWFSIDIVRKYLTTESGYCPELNSENAEFLRERWSDIEELFGENAITDTRKHLHRLEAERAKKMFG